VGVPIAAGWSEVVAVVVGGLITAGFTLLIEWQRRRRERRVAERLLSVEVDDAARTLVTVVGDLRDGKQWPHETKGWSQAWMGQRQALATGGVDDERLRMFGRTFGALQQLERSLATGQRDFVRDDPHFLQAVELQLTNFGIRLPDDYAQLTDTEVADLKAEIEFRSGSSQNDDDG
jgi:hypothetical protein